ncbi:MAG: hypothetical protein QF707_01120 [Candidatus Poseidoniaceae archaeon]|jgi:hypothetical protein|nr:hypothetical protein [Candidatus Poseidoniaceae archaeon]
MVGELSPDGQFMWDGNQWVPNQGIGMQNAANIATPEAGMVQQPGIQQPMVAQPVVGQPIMQQGGINPMTDGIAGDPTAGMWAPDGTAMSGGGKGKMFAIALIGIVLASGVGWGTYEFVIDPMLDPDPYTRAQFVEHALAQPSMEKVMNGEVTAWSCEVDLSLSDIEDELLGTFSMDMNTKLYASETAARADLDMTIRTESLPIPVKMDVWLSEGEMAVNTMGDAEVASFQSLGGEPAALLFGDEDALFAETIPFCFLNHEIAEAVDEDSSISFFSEAERFPNEDGERAVRVDVEYELDGEDLSISMYFDEDDKLIGGKASNSSGMNLLMKLDNGAVSEPSWLSGADDAPMPLEMEDDVWNNYSHGVYTINTQYNTTFDMTGVDLVLYSEEYDDEEMEDILVTKHSIDSLTNMLSQNATLQVSTMDGNANCTFNYTDNEPLNLISTGDVIGMACDGSADFYDLNIGLETAKGIAQPMELELPWISPALTLISIIGAALVLTRRLH